MFHHCLLCHACLIFVYRFPPGHGDVYESLQRSGLLDKLRAEGREYVFISNVDNLGATIDFDIRFHIC